MDVPQEELHGSLSLNPDWPLQGLVEFQNVTLRYMPSLPAALDDVTFTIAGGMQVGAQRLTHSLLLYFLQYCVQ